MNGLADHHAMRLVRFGIVGIFGVAVNTGILWTLVTMGGVHHLIAAAIGAEVSIVTNFIINDRWTFADHQASIPYWRRGMHYNAVAMSGTLLSLGLLAILTDAFGMYYLVANLMAIGAATLSNYALNMRFTWSLDLRRPQIAEVPVGD